MVQIITLFALAGFAAAAPAPNPNPATEIPAIVTQPPRGTEPGAAPTRVSPGPLTGSTTHGPYSSTPTTTGAVKASTTLQLSFDGIPPPNPTKTYYNTDGLLHSPAPFPYLPGGQLISL
jgi:hypothetical protein